MKIPMYYNARDYREIERMMKTSQTLATVKAEAVKEFAERLKTYYSHLDRTAGGLVEYHIDQVVKETLEGG